MDVTQRFLTVSRSLDSATKQRVRQAATSWARLAPSLHDERSVRDSARAALRPWFPRASLRELDTLAIYLFGIVAANAGREPANLDALDDLGQANALRLQMAMDRQSKLMSTLSNLLKKASETSQGIVQNIK